MSEAPIQLSDAEKRLLRGVFHRHALPYMAAMGLVLAIVAVPGTVEVTPEPDPRISEQLGALEQMHKELAALQDDVAAARSSGSADSDRASQRFASFDKRVVGFDKRVARIAGEVEALEVRLEKAESERAAAPALPAGEAASWDVGAILERLYDLEMRQERVEARSAGAAPAQGHP